MLRMIKTATLAASIAAVMTAGATAHMGNNNKIPAFDQNSLTVLDERGNCVLTKWDGMGNECGGKTDKAWRTVYFAFDSAVLRPESKEKLDRLYAKLNDESQNILRANIVGYADEIGTNDYNYKLSQRRADAVHGYLKGRGYQNADVTEIRALGERPDNNCPTTMKRKARIACLWEDRRVEIELEYLNKYRPIMR
ncbi:MAG: OmpA family protein [Alphaproteobacteria bacterium]|nr:OmpA family protein [Alphaproteobacteria bacterium]